MPNDPWSHRHTAQPKPNDPDKPQMGWVEGNGIFPSSSDDKKDSRGNYIIPWAVDEHGKSQALYCVDTHDPRYQACLSEAQRLRKEYPLDGCTPDAMADREKKIVEGLNEVIHQQYGDFNPEVEADEAQGKSAVNAPSLNHDVDRAFSAAQGHGEPPSSGPRDKKSGTLICRDYASIGESLLDEAGIPNDRVVGGHEEVDVHADGRVETTGKLGGHMFNVSRRTGAVIDFTGKGDTIENSCLYQGDVSVTNPSDHIASTRHSIIINRGKAPIYGIDHKTGTIINTNDMVEEFQVYTVGDGAHHKELGPQTDRDMQQGDRDAIARYMQTHAGQSIMQDLRDSLVRENTPGLVQPLPTPSSPPSTQKEGPVPRTNPK